GVWQVSGDLIDRGGAVDQTTGRPVRPTAPGDPGTDLESFYAANFGSLVVQLYAYTGDLGVAHEIVQDAICRAIPRWSTIAGYAGRLAGVRGGAFNLAKSRWRRMRVAAAYQRAHREEIVPEPSPDRVALVAALAKLPPSQRQAVVLHYL